MCLTSNFWGWTQKNYVRPSMRFWALSLEPPKHAKCKKIALGLHLLAPKVGGQMQFFCIGPSLNFWTLKGANAKKITFGLYWNSWASKEAEANTLASAKLQRILKTKKTKLGSMILSIILSSSHSKHIFSFIFAAGWNEQYFDPLNLLWEVFFCIRVQNALLLGL